jgi:hypothetical protein
LRAFSLRFCFAFFSPPYARRRPIRGATGKPIFSCFIVVVDRNGRARESGPIGEAIGVDDGSEADRGLANSADVHATTPANQELGGARPEPIVLDERPVLGPDLDRAVRIAGRARVVGAAERAAASPQPGVLDLCRVVSGPFAAMQLGDLGTDVVKVEEPELGDESRSYGPPFIGGESAYFLSINRNKRSCAIDLKSPAGKELILRLAGVADVVIENFRRGTIP